MKTPLGTEVILSPGHIVLDGVPAPRERGTAAPPPFGPCLWWPRSPISAIAELLFIFSNVCDVGVLYGQTVGWINMKRGMQIGLGPGHIVLDGDPAPPPKMGTAPNFRPISVVAKWSG